MTSGTTSQKLLDWLGSLPRLTVPATVLVLMLVGLMAYPVFAVPALAVVLAIVVWLASLAWPQADTGGRLLRVLIVSALAGLLVARAVQGVT